MRFTPLASEDLDFREYLAQNGFDVTKMGLGTEPGMVEQNAMPKYPVKALDSSDDEKAKASRGRSVEIVIT